MTPIAAIYARKSTDQNGVADEAKSVTRQIEHAKAYPVRKGWTVADEHVYVDDGISGAEFANRPGFLRLMNALKPRPPFQALIMSEESRLGREAIETACALKQIITSGVRVFFTLDDRERTLDSPTDKIMLSLTTFADELEREKARQRTREALQRKARAGQVTGGVVFRYQNIRTDGVGVMRRVKGDEAAVVREIVALYTAGRGVRGIAKHLNERGAPSPRPQQGRPAGWAPSSVHEVLQRPLYRGEVVWGRTKKRDRWGVKRQTPQAEADWIRVDVPELRIVPRISGRRFRLAVIRLGAVTWRRPQASGSAGRRTPSSRNTSAPAWFAAANAGQTSWSAHAVTESGGCRSTRARRFTIADGTSARTAWMRRWRWPTRRSWARSSDLSCTRT